MRRFSMIMCGSVVAATATADSADPQRPQYHFLPESNWMNDPNAPFYDSETGLYHLMYQYLTPRVWGHAVSTNMADWTILETALNYTDEWYTQVPGETPGVYSGSATIMRGSAEDRSQVWLSASTPTNDMVLLAYPSDPRDPALEQWTWDPSNPVVYADGGSDAPPGRDPTEFWPCGTPGNSTWCLAYATQQSEGCPCSGTSGFAVLSAKFDENVPMSELSWGDWAFEGYMLNDTAGAVMWECVDFFPLEEQSDPFAEAVWLLKYSIGPGPSYDLPWGDPGPREYYVTGVYDPAGVVDFQADPELWAAAMRRDTATALDVGAFYASKTFLSESHGRLLWGWLPEERPTDAHGNPFGWAGAMSLPRQVIPYLSADGQSWLVRTPPLEAVLEVIRTDGVEITDVIVEGNNFVNLNEVAGDQLEIAFSIRTVGMRDGDECGIRVLSSLQSGGVNTEYTDIGVRLSVNASGAFQAGSLYVDPSQSCANSSTRVNRTVAEAAPLRSELLDDLALIDVRVIVDHSVIESFLAGGRRAITRRVYPSDPSTSIGVQAYSVCRDPENCSQCSFSMIQAWAMRSTSIPDDDRTGSSSGDSSLKSWEISLIVILPVIAGAVAGLVYVFVFKPPKDSMKEELVVVQSRL